jgi:hypothetical protein
MKHALTGFAALVVVAALTPSCGGLGVSGTGPSESVEGGPHASSACGGSGDLCCDQTACNAGLTCMGGKCTGSDQAQDDATVDSSADAPADMPGDGSGYTGGDAGGDSDDSTDVDGSRTDSGNDAGSSPPIDASVPDASPKPDAAVACVATAAACMTTNPGACGPGTSECSDGGGPICRPAHTTQACYTGAAGTQAVGTCKDGTQSCIGALGACTGQVVPAAHDDCFTATDNDCNGTVGNGCPQALTIGADRTLTGAGGTGGTASTVHCPKGAFVTRVDSWFDDLNEHVSGVSIYCATPALVQGASSFSVKLTASTPAPYQKTTGTVAPTDERMDDCGTTGLTAITETTGLADTSIEGLGNHCGTSAVTLQADNTLTFAFTPSGDTSYNAWSDSTGTFFDDACNANEVVVGFTLRTAAWLFNIKPICAVLGVTYK